MRHTDLLPARRFANVVLCCGSLSVCLSFRPTQAGIVQKWLNTGSCKQRRTVAQGLQFSDAKDPDKIPLRSPPTRAPNASGVGKIDFFFDRSRSLRLRCLTAKNLYPSATVVRVDDGAVAEDYAVSSTTLVAVEVC